MTAAVHSKRQTIITKYLGPTNTKGPRVSAKCQAGSIRPEWDDALGSEENHAAACEALADKLGWGGTFVGGWVDGVGYVWVAV